MNNPRSEHSLWRWALSLLLVAAAAVLPAHGRAEELSLRHLYTLERYGENLRFLTPIAVFMDARHQELYVCDAGASRLISFTADGANLGYFYNRQKGQQARPEPVGVAVDSGRTVFVASASSDRISKYDYRGGPLGYISMPGGGSRFPGKMTVDASGSLYVADKSTGKIVVFDAGGNVKTEIADSGSDGMQECCDVAVDDERVYALSPKGTVVRVFNRQGELIRKFGKHEPGKAGFSRPSGLDVDGKGRIWVTDVVGQTLKAFGPDGAFLKEFGGFGTNPGDFFSPADVCIDRSKGTLFVVEKSGRRLQAFKIEER